MEKDNDKKKVDPGWNDPPMLNYSPSNPPPKSRIANKRIPFPMSICSSSSCSTSAVPASPVFPQPPPPPKSAPSLPKIPLEKLQEISDELFKNAKDNFGKFIITQKSQKTKECIHALYKAWEEKRFSLECQENIYLFSQYLADNDAISAKAVKERLLTDYKELCEDWLLNFVI